MTHAHNVTCGRSLHDWSFLKLASSFWIATAQSVLIIPLLRISRESPLCIAVETITIPNATEPADYVRPDLRFSANRAVLPRAKACLEFMKVSQFLPIWTIVYKQIKGDVGLISCAGVILR